MRNIIIASVLIIISLNANGQSGFKAIGSTVAIDYYKYSFKEIPNFKHTFELNICFSHGYNYQTKLIGKFLFSGGIGVSGKNFTLKYDNTYVTDRKETYLESLYFDCALQASFPLITKGRFGLFTSTGILLSSEIGNRERTQMSNGSIRSSEYMNTFYPYLDYKLPNNQYLVELSFNLKYRIVPKFYATISPVLRYGLREFENDVLITRLNSISGQIGVQYNLSK